MTKRSLYAILVFSLFLSIGIYIYTDMQKPKNIPQRIEKEVTIITPPEEKAKDYIKWVDFSPNAKMLNKALNYDLDSKGQLSWITLLAYSVSKNWGNCAPVCLKYIDECASLLKDGQDIKELTKDNKYYDFYYEAYSAVLGGLVGEKEDKSYGIKACSPIPKDFYFSHYDDFGASRTYGFARTHKGNDLLCSVGTPVTAVENGYIESMGWNQYGGWRIGIRSYDKKRYYYYAHLRKDHPFRNGLKEGDEVRAGDVIGYVGMTGYSTKENVNNIKTPHLHFGLELIFDEKQKDSVSEIWVDVYNIIEILNKNKSEVIFDETQKEYNKVGSFE